MSTVVEQTPAKAGSPVEPSIADVLYATEPAHAADTSVVSTTEPAQKQDTDLAPANKADATPPADAKQEPVAKAEGKTEEKPDPKDEQLKAQTAAARRLGKEKAELERKLEDQTAQIEELKARIEGTWKEPPKPSDEQIRKKLAFEARVEASRAIADQDFGADEVEQAIFGGKDAPWVALTSRPEKKHLLVEVSEHPQPPVAAMRILAREAFMEKFGEDPRKWEEKILEAAKPKLFAEFKKQLEQQPVGKDVPTVSTARQSGGPAARKEQRIADVLYGGD